MAREFWINNYPEFISNAFAYESEEQALANQNGHKVELFHVIEKSAYDSLMEQANKLANALQDYVETYERPGKRLTVLKDFEKFKGGQE